MARSNRTIDQLIAFGKWEIEPVFALTALYQYLEELDLLEISQDAKTDYSKKREELLPVIWSQGLQITNGYGMLSSQEIPENSIAHLQLSGVMRLQDGLSSRGVKQLSTDLKNADRNPNIKGIILEVNSGGGEVLAGSYLQNTMREMTTPVYTWSHLEASAAYKGTLPATKKFLSSQDSEVGSIGSMLILDRKIMQYLVENQQEIYATTSPNKNAEWREFLKGNIQPMVQAITERNEAFLDAVKEFRQLSGDEKQVEDTLSGHLFRAKEGINRGLVDGVGTFEQVMDDLTNRILSKDQITFSYSNIQQNQPSMDKTFLQRLTAQLASKFGVKVDIQGKTDAETAEAVAKALEESQSIDDMKADIIKAAAEQAASAMKEGQQATDTTQFDELKKMLSGVQASFENLQGEIKAVQIEVAEMKGKKLDDAQGKKDESDVPDRNQFKTTQSFLHTMTPDTVGSKY